MKVYLEYRVYQGTPRVHGISRYTGYQGTPRVQYVDIKVKPTAKKL